MAFLPFALSPFTCRATAWTLALGLVLSTRAFGGESPPAAAAAAAESLPAEEARALLRGAQSNRELGSFRTESVRPTKHGRVTTVTLRKLVEGQPTRTRTERVTETDGAPEKTHTRITVTNVDGMWRLLPGKAILMPNPFDFSRVGLALTNGNANPEPGLNLTASDRETLQRAAALAADVTFAGERYRERDRTLVRVTRTYGKDAQKFMRQMVDRQVTELKKQLPLGKRMLVSTILAVKGGADAMMPVRETFVIDPEKNRVVETESFNASGKSVNKRTVPVPEKVADLPDELFAIPAGAEQIRPATIVEAEELVEKLENEARKAHEPS